MDTCMKNQTIKRIFRMKYSEQTFNNLDTTGYKFIIPQYDKIKIEVPVICGSIPVSFAKKYNSELNKIIDGFIYLEPEKVPEYVYVVSYYEEYYDIKTNNFMSNYNLFSLFPYFLYDYEYQFIKDNLLTTNNKDEINSNFIDIEKETLFYSLFMNNDFLSYNLRNLKKKIKFYKKIKNMKLKTTDICRDFPFLSTELNINNNLNSIDSFLIHPLFILFLDFINPKSSLYQKLQQNLFRRLQFSYEYVLKQIELKENIKFDNYNLFDCYSINTHSFKYLSSIIAIQDYYFIFDIFSDFCDNNKDFHYYLTEDVNKILNTQFYTLKTEWPLILAENAILSNHYTKLPISLFNCQFENNSRFNIEQLEIKNLIADILNNQNHMYINLILNNNSFSIYHDYIKNTLESKKLYSIFSSNIDYQHMKKRI